MTALGGEADSVDMVMLRYINWY